MTSKKTILVLGGLFEIHKRLIDLGHRVISIALDSETKLIPSEISEKLYAGPFIFPENTELEIIVNFGTDLANSHSIDVVFCYTELLQVATAFIAKNLGLNYHKTKTVFRVQDKYEMRKELNTQGISQPFFEIYQDLSSLLEDSEKFSFPVVIKPVSSWGSRGIRICKDLDSLIDTVSMAFSDVVFNGKVLVEQKLLGQEFSVEFFSENGEHYPLAITRKFLHQGSFIEAAHVLPALLEEKQKETIENYVATILSKLGIENGITHTEIIINDDVINVLETHIRVGGDNIYNLLSAALDVDILDLILRQSIGEKIGDVLNELAPSKSAAVVYAINTQPSKIKSIRGLKNVNDHDGIIDVKMACSEGHFLPQTKDSFSRIGRISAVGETESEAIKCATEAWKEIYLSSEFPLEHNVSSNVVEFSRQQKVEQSQRKTILIVHSANVSRLRHFKKLRSLNYRFLLMMDKPAWESQFVDRVFPTNTKDLGSVKQIAETLKKSENIDGVITFTEHGVPAAAAVADVLGLNSNSEKVALFARDKFRMRQRFQEHEIPNPEFGLISSVNEACSFLNQVGAPIVIKPIIGGGSQFIRLMKTEEDIKNYLPLILENAWEEFKYDPLYSVLKSEYNNAVLAEEYLEGGECSIESLIHNGKSYHIAIHDKPLPMRGPYFTEHYYRTPSVLSVEIQNALFDIVSRAHKAIGMTSGACLLYTSPSPRDGLLSRMPSSA